MTIEEPKIVYKHMTINESNVDSFFKCPYAGEYSRETNIITIYKYSLSSKIQEPKKSEIESMITNIDYDKTLAHEKQHFRNHLVVPEFFDFCYMHYYQENSLKCLDEVSALTAGVLYTNPKYVANGVCQETVISSLLQGTHIFLNFYFDTYMKRFNKDILENHHIDVNASDIDYALIFLQQLQQRYKTDPKTLFGEKFQDAIKGFFTYDGYCILDDKISYASAHGWNTVKNNFAEIKRKCLEETSIMIDELIKTDMAKKAR